MAWRSSSTGARRCRRGRCAQPAGRAEQECGNSWHRGSVERRQPGGPTCVARVAERIHRVKRVETERLGERPPGRGSLADEDRSRPDVSRCEGQQEPDRSGAHDHDRVANDDVSATGAWTTPAALPGRPPPDRIRPARRTRRVHDDAPTSPPSRSMPIRRRLAHTCRSPRRQAEQSPQAMSGSTTTARPASCPAVARPTSSCPRTSGKRARGWEPSTMCRSVPHRPTRSTSMATASPVDSAGGRCSTTKLSTPVRTRAGRFIGGPGRRHLP